MSTIRDLDATSLHVRRNTLLLMVSMALAFAGLQHIPTLGSLLASRITGGDGSAGIPMAIGTVGFALAVYPAGRLMDRLGRKRIVIAGHVVGAIGAVLVWLAVLTSSFPGVLAGSMVMGAGVGVGMLARLAIADFYVPAQRGKAVGFGVMGITAGAFGGPLLTGWVARTAEAMGADPLAVPWLVAAFIFTVGAAVVLRVSPEPREAAAALGRLQPAASAAGASLADPSGVLTATIVAALVQAAMVAMMSVMPLVMSHHGVDLGLITAMMAAHFVGMYALAIPIGRTADLIGKRQVIGAGVIITASGVLLAGLGMSYSAAVAGLFLVGVGWCCSFVAGTALVTNAAPQKERGKALGRYDLAAWMAAALVTFGAGPLLVFAGSEGVALVLAGGALVGLGPLILLRKPAAAQVNP